MDKRLYFERNLLALSQKDPVLCTRLSGAETTRGHYKFLESRTGERVPALVDSGGAAHPLHSLVDPRREGRRLIGTLGDEGYLVFFGFGGAFHIAAALEREDIQHVLVIDYDINGVAELLASGEYIRILRDSRLYFMVDPPPGLLERYILDTFQPVLYGGLRVIPLRTRTEQDPVLFSRAGETVKSTMDALAADYSVQAYFGTRWFSNIIRNLFRAERQEGPLPPIRNAAVCAAGPSLDIQLPILKERRGSSYLIASDTSLPSLLRAGIEPDAVVSIDCQHISYYHFIAGLPGHIPLFLDLASPPLLAARSQHPRFFAGGHPLTRYVSRYWRSLPLLDTAGANVTYAALSLAERLGAAQIELYGADFSYPLGRTYARGTYLYPYFEVRQNRFTPLEGQHSAFLYRNSVLNRIERVPSPDDPEKTGGWYYETPVLKRYREGVETKAGSLRAVLKPIPSLGAPIMIPDTGRGEPRPGTPLFAAGRMTMGAGDFLAGYRAKIAALPPVKPDVSRYIRDLDEEERPVLATLLPGAAALKRRNPVMGGAAALEAVREYSLGELDRVMGLSDPDALPLPGNSRND
jgi:hypothetical protein